MAVMGTFPYSKLPESTFLSLTPTHQKAKSASTQHLSHVSPSRVYHDNFSLSMSSDRVDADTQNEPSRVCLSDVCCNY